MRPSPYLREIERLDPVRDAERIVFLDACFEFPFDVTRSLELAFFRTFAVPASPSGSIPPASSSSGRPGGTTTPTC